MRHGHGAEAQTCEGQSLGPFVGDQEGFARDVELLRGHARNCQWPRPKGPTAPAQRTAPGPSLLNEGALDLLPGHCECHIQRAFARAIRAV